MASKKVESEPTGETAKDLNPVYRQAGIAELCRDPRNVRVHGPRNLDSIEASLREFGQVEPLVVQRSTGKVVGGNGRLAVMERLGWSECAVVELDLSDVQAAALGVALNRTGEHADWDDAGLAGILALVQASPEVAIEATGYSEEEINALLTGLAYDTAQDVSGDDGAMKSEDRPDGRRIKGSARPTVKVVLTSPEVATVEAALRATGEKNRALAMLAICRSFLGERSSGETEGQFND